MPQLQEKTLANNPTSLCLRSPLSAWRQELAGSGEDDEWVCCGCNRVCRVSQKLDLISSARVPVPDSGGAGRKRGGESEGGSRRREGGRGEM